MWEVYSWYWIQTENGIVQTEPKVFDTVPTEYDAMEMCWKFNQESFDNKSRVYWDYRQVV